MTYIKDPRNRSDPLIRQSQVAQQLGVSDATIKRWRLSGNFPPGYLLTPKTIVWRLSDVLSWLEERRVVPEAIGDRADSGNGK